MEQLPSIPISARYDVTDNEVTTAGKLRAITAQCRAVDAVEAYVYLPNTRGPVKVFIAGWLLRAPSSGADNVLTLQLRPVPEPEPPLPEPLPVEPPLPFPELPDCGAAGKKTDRVPNAEGGP